MNVKEYVTREQADLQNQIKRLQDEVEADTRGVDHLPQELREMPGCIMMVHYYLNSYGLHYSDPNNWKALKMAGVVGLKRVFGGKNENDWRWEGGQLRTSEGYEYDIDINKAHRPQSCRLEETVEMVPVKKLIAICPESLEPV